MSNTQKQFIESKLRLFEDKFPCRIYGIAGEPKSEFISTENYPDKIKSFLSTALKEIVEEHWASIKSKIDNETFSPYERKIKNDTLDKITSRHKEFIK